MTTVGVAVVFSVTPIAKCCVVVMWVDQSRTLVQQGIAEGDVLLLKRRYFYSDQNVDARDPVQCNLLYVQVLTGL